MDKLDILFSLQEKFDERVIRERCIDFDTETWIQKEILAMMGELVELLEETNWKWWRNPKSVRMEAIKEELVDLLHFFLSTCLKCGIGPEELYQAYLAKNQENHARQDGTSQRDGYAVASFKRGEIP